MLTSVAFQKLGEAKSSGSRAYEKDTRAYFGSYPVHAVDGAGGGFKQSGFFPGKIVEFEEFFGGEYAVLCKSAIDCFLISSTLAHTQDKEIGQRTMNAVGGKILAVQQFSFTAEMAVSTEFRVVCCNFIANGEAFDRFADLDDDPACFVTSDHGHLGVEVAVMNVEVCSADTTGFY